MTKYAVTVIDYGETCDGKARFLGMFDAEKEAKDFVRRDMEDWLALSKEEGIEVDYGRMSAYYKRRDGRSEWNVEMCEWNVEAVETDEQPGGYEHLKKRVREVLTDPGRCAEDMVAEIGEIVGIGE